MELNSRDLCSILSPSIEVTGADSLICCMYLLVRYQTAVQMDSFATPVYAYMHPPITGCPKWIALILLGGDISSSCLLCLKSGWVKIWKATSISCKLIAIEVNRFLSVLWTISIRRLQGAEKLIFSNNRSQLPPITVRSSFPFNEVLSQNCRVNT